MQFKIITNTYGEHCAIFEKMSYQFHYMNGYFLKKYLGMTVNDYYNDIKYLAQSSYLIIYYGTESFPGYGTVLSKNKTDMQNIIHYLNGKYALFLSIIFKNES